MKIIIIISGNTLFLGVVAWAVSAEVVMGARRDAARKNSDSSLRFRQVRFNVLLKLT